MDGSKPKLLVERAMDKEISFGDLPNRPPHCDPRILHAPEECTYCAEAVDLQEERVRLGVCNTGKKDRPWPCPVEKARSLQTAHKWHGNTPMTEERAKREREEWREFSRELMGEMMDEFGIVPDDYLDDD